MTNNTSGSATSSSNTRRDALAGAAKTIGQTLSNSGAAVISRIGATLDQLLAWVVRQWPTVRASAGRLLGAVDSTLAHSDIRVELSDHTLEIDGNDTGVQTVEATVVDAVNDSTLYVDYDRAQGLNITIRH